MVFPGFKKQEHPSDSAGSPVHLLAIYDAKISQTHTKRVNLQFQTIQKDDQGGQLRRNISIHTGIYSRRYGNINQKKLNTDAHIITGRTLY